MYHLREEVEVFCCLAAKWMISIEAHGVEVIAAFEALVDLCLLRKAPPSPVGCTSCWLSERMGRMFLTLASTHKLSRMNT